MGEHELNKCKYEQGSTTRRAILDKENGEEVNPECILTTSRRQGAWRGKNMLTSGGGFLTELKQTKDDLRSDRKESGMDDEDQHDIFNCNKVENDDSEDQDSVGQVEKQQNNSPFDDKDQKTNIRPQNVITKDKVKRSMFSELIFNVRMKNKAKFLANSTNSRMQKNLRVSQLKMIGDKSCQQENIQIESQGMGEQERLQLNKSFIFKFLQRMNFFLPVIDPRSNRKVYFEVLNLLALALILYSFSVIIAFKFQIQTVIDPIYLQLALGCVFSNSIVNLSTGYYQGGKLLNDRHAMFKLYYEKHFFVDVSSLISTLLLLILNNAGFEAYVSEIEIQNSDSEVSELCSLVRIILFAPFLLKLRDFSHFMQSFEEKVIFHSRVQNYIQLVRLFSTVVLIEHAMACIWIFTAKLSFNVSSSWETKRNIQFDPWFKQYTLSFYYATVTMTTVGYGDITPSNQTEYIVCIFMMLISSGVFGFTLNQIGSIFSEMHAEQKEVRRKMNIINLHMERKNVNHALRTQIRQYLEQQLYIFEKNDKIYFFYSYVWKENNEKFSNDSSAIVEQLNDSLKKELQLHQNKRIIDYLKIHFSENFIEKAVTLIEEIHCKPQQIIYRAGEKEDISLYFVEKGKVEIIFKTKAIKKSPASQHIIHQIGEGKLFGIRQFFIGNREQNVRAVGFTNLLRIKRDDFLAHIEQFPEDKEAFCYVRDRITLLQDSWTSGSACPSCGSFKHSLTGCNYLHFVPNRLNICLRHSYMGGDCAQKTRRDFQLLQEKKEEDSQDQFRKQHKDLRLFNLAEQLNEFQNDNAEFVEAYEEQYLHYNFDYSYINDTRRLQIDDDDRQTEKSDYFKQGSFSISRQVDINKEPCYSALNPDQNDPNIVPQENKITNPSDQQISSPRAKRQSSNFDSSNSPKFSFSIDRQQSIPDQNSHRSLIHPIRATAKEQQGEYKRLQSPTNKRRSRPRCGSLIMNQQVSPALKQKKNSKQTLIILDNESFPNLNIVSANPNPPNGFSASGYNTQEAGIVPESQNTNQYSSAQLNDYSNTNLNQAKTQNSNQIILNHLQNKSGEKNGFLMDLNGLMNKLQNNILLNIERILSKNQLSLKPSLIRKPTVIDEMNEHYGLQQIFWNFDKQKNFEIYFPFNNLNYLLLKLQLKSNKAQSLYLDHLQMKKRVIPGFQQSSLPNISRQRLSRLFTMTERFTRTLIQQQQDVSKPKNSENELNIFDSGQRVKSYVDKHTNFIESPVSMSDRTMLNSPRRSETGKNLNHIQLKGDNFSKQFAILQELSPNLKEDTNILSDRNKINSMQFQNKTNYFSKF